MTSRSLIALVSASAFSLSAALSAADTRTTSAVAGDDAPARPTHIFARGFTYQNGQLNGMAVARIDPHTGAWTKLLSEGAMFSVSPDGETIAFGRDGSLWNGDAATCANPGKIFSEDGTVVFAPDSREMLVSTWKKKADKDEWTSTVHRMGYAGQAPVPVETLAGMYIRDWSPDGAWLAVEKNADVHLAKPDGSDSRLLAKDAFHPRFSPDGTCVAYVKQWQGKVHTVDLGGNNDRVVFLAPPLTFVCMAEWSRDGTHMAAVLQDLRLGNDGRTPTLAADPQVTHPRLVLINLEDGQFRVVPLPAQDGWEFAPTGEIQWR
jgi:Tol biopolymer transport system component